MRYETGYLPLVNERLHYIKIGSGKRLLLGFPGYGQTAASFLPFHEYFQNEFTFYTFDLPHHGNSKWERGILSADLLVHLISTVMEMEKATKISLLGYSIGGRICLKVIELLPDKIDNVLLIASDGLTFSYFYYFATRTWLGRKMFKGVVSEPKFFFRIIKSLKYLNLLDESRYKFAMQYLTTFENRNFLFNVWNSLKDIIPLQKKARNNINKYRIPVHLFMGQRDRIIPFRFAIKFKYNLKTVVLHFLDKGHRVIDLDNIQKMAKCLIN